MMNGSKGQDAEAASEAAAEAAGEAGLEARMTQLEGLMQQQAHSNARLVQDLSSKMDRLLELFLTMQQQPPAQPQAQPPELGGVPGQCGAGKVAPSLDNPGVEPSGQSHPAMHPPPQQPQQPAAATAKAAVGTFSSPAPESHDPRVEGPPVAVGAPSQLPTSAYTNPVYVTSHPASPPSPGQSAAASQHGGHNSDDVISNTPADDPPGPLNSPGFPGGVTEEDQFLMDIPDDDLFASNPPVGLRRRQELYAGGGGANPVQCVNEIEPVEEEEEEEISNVPVGATSDTRPPSDWGPVQGPATSAGQMLSQPAAHVPDTTAAPSSFPASSLQEQQEHRPREVVQYCRQAPSPHPAYQTPLPSSAAAPRTVQFSPECNAQSRESAHPRERTPGTFPARLPAYVNVPGGGAQRRGLRGTVPAQEKDLEAAAQSILRGLKVSRNDTFKEVVIRALIEERPSPRAVTAQTVLCLDCSPSIGDQGLAAMKTAALAFVSGIEEVAEQHGLDENLGVVTFGSSTEVAQHLTIDYQAVREAIESVSLDGRSPLFEALVVCVAAFKDKGGALSIAHVHTIRPRVILFTDGIATQTTGTDGPENYESTPTHRRVNLIQFVTEIARHPGTPSPIVWVPVGKADKDFLKNLAKIGKGKYVEPEDLPKECHYFHFHSMLGKAYVCVKDSKPGSHDDESLRTLVSAIFGDVRDIDKDELVQALKEKLNKKNEEKIRADDFRRYLERSELPPLGSRMRRAQGWRWGDQDGGGLAGTIINHCHKDQEWVYVQWDHGPYNRYRYLPDETGDVTLTDSPRLLNEGERIAIGARVKRGPDWNQGNSDGGPNNVGVVIRLRDDGKIRVRWPNGQFGTFMWEDEEGKQCLELVDKQEEHTLSKHVYQETRSAPPEEQADDPSGRPKVVVWQWSSTGKEGDWTNYDEETKTKLEMQYLSRPQSTCVIERDGSRRVSFKKLEEWRVDDASVRNLVRRLLEDVGE